MWSVFVRGARAPLSVYSVLQCNRVYVCAVVLLIDWIQFVSTKIITWLHAWPVYGYSESRLYASRLTHSQFYVNATPSHVMWRTYVLICWHVYNRLPTFDVFVRHSHSQFLSHCVFGCSRRTICRFVCALDFTYSRSQPWKRHIRWAQLRINTNKNFYA